MLRLVIACLVFAAWCGPARAQDDEEIPPPRSMREMVQAIAGPSDFPGAHLVSVEGDADGATITLQSDECKEIQVHLIWSGSAESAFVLGGVQMRPSGNGITDLVEERTGEGQSFLTYRYYWMGPPRVHKTRAALFDGLTYIEVESELEGQRLRDIASQGGEPFADAHKRIHERDAAVLERVMSRYYATGIYDSLKNRQGSSTGTSPGAGVPRGGSGGGGLGGGGTGGGGGGTVTEEQVAVAAAAITLILIAAGVGVNTARAVAVALAEAGIAAGMTPAQTVQAVADRIGPPEPPLFDSTGDEVYREGEGYRWGDRIVSRAEAERLIEEERQRRNRQQAQAMAEHDRFRDQSWDELREGSRQPDFEEQRRQQLTSIFDREAAAAEGWIEQYDPAYLGRLDRLRARVAAQGYATVADVQAMRGLGGDFWGRLQNQNTRDAIETNRIASNIRNAPQIAEDVGWEIIKTGAAYSNPAGAFYAAGAVAVAQSVRRGDSLSEGAENVLWSGLFNAGEVRIATRLGARPVLTMAAGTATGAAEGFVRSRGDLHATAMGAAFGTVGGGSSALGIFRTNRLGGARGRLPTIPGDALMDVHAPRVPRGGPGPNFDGLEGVRPPSRPGVGAPDTPGAPISRPRGDGPGVQGRGGGSGAADDVGPAVNRAGGTPPPPPETPGGVGGARRQGVPAGEQPSTPPPVPPREPPAPPSRPARSADGLEMGGQPVQGPANAQAADAWQRAGADARGHIHDQHGNRIARISPEGEITSLTGRPARITRDAAGRTTGFEETNPHQGGTLRDVEFDSSGASHTAVPRDQGGEPRISVRTRMDGEAMEIGHPLDMERNLTPIHGEHMPRPARTPLFNDPGARAAAAGAGAGPGGEIFGLDGRVIGQVHPDGTMTAVVNGQRVQVVGHGLPQGGRVPWIRVRDGAGNLRTFRGDGTLTSGSALRTEFGNTPGGRPLTPTHAAEARGLAQDLSGIRARNDMPTGEGGGNAMINQDLHGTGQHGAIPSADDLPDAGWRQRPPEILPQDGYQPGGRPAPEVPPAPRQHEPTWGPRPDADNLPDAGWRERPPLIDPDSGPGTMPDAGWRQRPQEILPQEGYQPGGRPAPEVPSRPPPAGPAGGEPLPRADDLPDAVWKDPPPTLRSSDVPNPPSPQRLEQLAAGTPLSGGDVGRQLGGLPQDAYFVQQRGRNDCVVACTAMAGGGKYDAAAGLLQGHRNTIQIGNQPAEALGVPASRIEDALRTANLNPQGVVASTPANGRVIDNVIDRVGSGQKIVAHVSSQRHAVVIDRAWRSADGKPMARVLDPRGAAYEIDLSRADWKGVFDWKTSFFVRGTS